MSDHETGNSTSVSVMSEEVAWQIKAVFDSLTQELTHFCKLLRELRDEQFTRCHEQTASFRAACSSSCSSSRSDTVWSQTLTWWKVTTSIRSCQNIKHMEKILISCEKDQICIEAKHLNTFSVSVSSHINASLWRQMKLFTRQCRL